MSHYSLETFNGISGESITPLRRVKNSVETKEN